MTELVSILLDNALSYCPLNGTVCVNNTWSYIRTDNGERHSMKNPLKQADKSKYYFLKVLDEYFEDTEYTDHPQYCMVESAVWFPSVSRRDVIGVLPMEFHPEITLLENALDSPQKFIDGIYEFYEGWRHTRLDRTTEDAILDLFAPLYQVMPSLKSKRLEQEETFIRLTREQYSLLDYLEEQRVAAIQGAAGTGKTLLAIEKARRLSGSGTTLSARREATAMFCLPQPESLKALRQMPLLLLTLTLIHLPKRKARDCFTSAHREQSIILILFSSETRLILMQW